MLKFSGCFSLHSLPGVYLSGLAPRAPTAYVTSPLHVLAHRTLTLEFPPQPVLCRLHLSKWYHPPTCISQNLGVKLGLFLPSPPLILAISKSCQHRVHIFSNPLSPSSTPLTRAPSVASSPRAFLLLPPSTFSTQPVAPQPHWGTGQTSPALGPFTCGCSAESMFAQLCLGSSYTFF